MKASPQFVTPPDANATASTASCAHSTTSCAHSTTSSATSTATCAPLPRPQHRARSWYFSPAGGTRAIMGGICSAAVALAADPPHHQEEVCMGKYASGCVTRRGALRVLGGSALGLAGLALAGCDAGSKGGSGSGGGAAAVIGKPHKGTCKIGVLQLADHAALDSARKGFEQELKSSGMRYKLDVQHANNDVLFCQGVAGAQCIL